MKVTRLAVAVLIVLGAWAWGASPNAFGQQTTTTSTSTTSTTRPLTTTTSTTRPATVTSTTLVNTGSESGPTALGGLAFVLFGAVLVRVAWNRRVNGPYRLRDGRVLRP